MKAEAVVSLSTRLAWLAEQAPKTPEGRPDSFVLGREFAYEILSFFRNNPGALDAPAKNPEATAVAKQLAALKNALLREGFTRNEALAILLASVNTKEDNK